MIRFRPRAEKADAIRGAPKPGLLNVLITDEKAARKVPGEAINTNG